MNSQSELSSNFVATVSSDEALSVAANLAEVGVDSLIEEGALRVIPFISSIFSIAKVGMAISDQLLVKKIITFLNVLNEIPSQHRSSMIRRLNDDKSYRERVGEHLLEIMSRIEAFRKPEMIGVVFSAFASRNIDFKMLQRLIVAIERIPIEEVRNLRPFNNRSEDTPFEAELYTTQAFTNAGLTTVKSGYGELSYWPNDVAKTFLELGLDQTGI